jgi:hypothetical protein
VFWISSKVELRRFHRFNRNSPDPGPMRIRIVPLGVLGNQKSRSMRVKTPIEAVFDRAEVVKRCFLWVRSPFSPPCLRNLTRRLHVGAGGRRSYGRVSGLPSGIARAWGAASFAPKEDGLQLDAVLSIVPLNLNRSVELPCCHKL